MYSFQSYLGFVYQNVASKLWIHFKFSLYMPFACEGTILFVITQLYVVFGHLKCASGMYDLRNFIGSSDKVLEII